MSTRCHIRVLQEDGSIHPVMIYRHSDGYPNGEHGVPAFLKPFVKKFIEERGTDPEYFLAQFLRHEAFHQQENTDKEMIAHKKQNHEDIYEKYPEYQPKNSLLGYGVGLSSNVHGDISYMYTVNLEAGTILVETGNQEKVKTIQCLSKPKSSPKAKEAQALLANAKRH